MEKRITEINEQTCFFSKCADVDLDHQENLPSYYDDILKVVRCSADNFIVNTSFQNGSITVRGKSRITVTYISETEKCLCCAEFEEDFEKSIQLSSDDEEIFCEAEICPKYCSSRVVNQRRVDVHNSFCLCVRAYRICSCNMLDECEDLCIHRFETEHLSRIGSAYLRSDFECDTAAPDGPVKKIINVFAHPICKDVKLTDDKLLVKTEIGFSVLYTVDGEPEEVKRCETTVQVSCVADIPGAEQGDLPLVSVTMGDLYFKIKADENEKLNVIELAGDICVSCVVYRKCGIAVSDDCYSLSAAASGVYSQLSLDTDCSAVSDSTSQTMRFEFSSADIQRVADLCAVMADGCVELRAFVVNSENELQFISGRLKPDIAKHSVINAYVASFDYVLKSQTVIELRVVIAYFALDYTTRQFRVLSDVELGEEQSVQTPALTLYFADKDEKLWNIAKAFKTSVELIQKENDISKDFCETRRVLLIPGV